MTDHLKSPTRWKRKLPRSRLLGSDPSCDPEIPDPLFHSLSRSSLITKVHHPFVPNQPLRNFACNYPRLCSTQNQHREPRPESIRFGPFCFLCRRQDYIIRNKTGLLSHANVKRKAGFGFKPNLQKSPKTREKQTKGEQNNAHRKSDLTNTNQIACSRNVQFYLFFW